MERDLFDQCTFVYRPRENSNVPEQAIVFETYVDAIKFCDMVKSEIGQLGLNRAYKKMKHTAHYNKQLQARRDKNTEEAHGGKIVVPNNYFS